ncbi:hypothetical protein ACE6H2_015956 [Prunus campanulata]
MQTLDNFDLSRKDSKPKSLLLQVLGLLQFHCLPSPNCSDDGWAVLLFFLLVCLLPSLSCGLGLPLLGRELFGIE